MDFSHIIHKYFRKGFHFYCIKYYIFPLLNYIENISKKLSKKKGAFTKIIHAKHKIIKSDFIFTQIYMKIIEILLFCLN